MEACSLRRSVTKQQDDVWQLREDLDLYTLNPRALVQRYDPEVDHMLEVMLFERAFESARQSNGAMSKQGFAVAHAGELLRDRCNALTNLNVTTRRINQKKKGPIGAAMRRIIHANGPHELRVVSLCQFARMGAARELVENGVWTRIERSMQTQIEEFDVWVDDLNLDPELDVRIHRSVVRLLNATRNTLLHSTELFRLE